MKTNNFFYIFLFFLNLSLANAIADEFDTQVEEKGIFSTIADDFRATGRDYAIIWDDLTTPTFKHIMYPLAFANSAYATSQLDLDFRVSPQHKQDIKPLRYMGETYTAVALPSALYLGGLAFGSEKVRTTGRLLFESMLLTFAVNQTTKIIAGRARPFLNQGNSDFRFFEMNDDYQSFPSGHTAAAFTIATVLSERINNVFASTALYLLAAGTATQRIIQDRHWFSDVVIGAMVGTLCSKAVLSASEREAFWVYTDTNAESTLHYRFSPSYGFNGLSLNFTMTW